MTVSDTERTPLLDEAAVSAKSKPEEQASHGAARFWTFDRQETLALISLSTGNLLAGCLLAVMIPFFPLEATRRNISETVTGAVFSSFAVAQLLVYPLMSRLVPRIGATLLMNLGLALAGVSTIVFGALPSIQDSRTFISCCFVARIIEAVGTSALNTSAFAIVANRFTVKTGMAISLLETMTGVGVSLGPAVGGVLYQLGGYGTPFYSLGAVMIIMAPINMRVMPVVTSVRTLNERFFQMARVYFSSPGVLLCSAITLTVSINWTAIDPNVSPYVFKYIGITPAELGLYFLIATGTFSVFGMAWGRLSDYVTNTYAMMAVSLSGVVVGLLLMPPSPITGLLPSWWLFGVGLTTKEVFQGGTYVPIFGKLSRLCASLNMDDNLETQSFISSMFFTIFSIGNVFGPTLGGLVNDNFGFPIMVSFLALWTILICLITATAAVAQYLLNRRANTTK